MCLLATLVVCLFGRPNRALGDPVWIPPKGTIHTAIAYTQGQWDQFLQDGNQSVDLPGKITQYEFTILGEYVLLENLSFDILLPIVIVQREFVFVETNVLGDILGVQTGPKGEVRDVDTNTGLGDIVLGSKYVFWKKYVSLGVRPWIKFPGTYSYGEIPNAPGDGQTDLGLAFLVGSYFPRPRIYVRGSLGLVHRFGDPASQMEFLIEPGINITKYISARVLYQHIEQFGGDDILVYGIPNYYPGNDEDSDRIGAGLTYRATDNIGIFGLYQQTVAGDNTSNTKAFTFGIDLMF